MTIRKTKIIVIVLNQRKGIYIHNRCNVNPGYYSGRNLVKKTTEMYITSERLKITGIPANILVEPHLWKIAIYFIITDQTNVQV